MIPSSTRYASSSGDAMGLAARPEPAGDAPALARRLQGLVRRALTHEEHERPAARREREPGDVVRVVDHELASGVERPIGVEIDHRRDDALVAVMVTIEVRSI